ncbi:glutamine amidotransferase-like class 1 domain-containing protein 1 isoform X1 [Tachypleus tridentatus]|uniref:glutamine amidotransferase-like class 1 domain-containing protein 1 isoform X1 n=1 Tax=Tachypleus tridentatus TaxID=6853 RepID=UPI003FD370D9
MSSMRQNCLIVLSGAKEGNSVQSFIQSFTLLHTAFTVQIATPGGKSLEFVNQDEQSRRWLNDFRMKTFAVPISLHAVDPDRYMCLILPHSPGAATDLVHDKDLALILKHFVKEKKPICAIAMGVVGLFPAMEDSSSWSFRRYTLTSVSVFELARDPDFASLPVIPEDIIKDRGALYSSSEPDEVHVVVDRHLITGQNEQSTLTAVQNLILLCNQKQGRKDKF